MIDVESGTVTQKISTEYLCHGITHRDGLLFYCVMGKGIYRFTIKDSNVKRIVACNLSDWSYISSFNDKLYYAQKNKSTVTCCNIDGKIHWTFKNESILVYPGGLTVDNDGYIYIVSYQHYSVVVLSPDGQQSRTLLSEHSTLQKPSAVKFDKERHYLLITNDSKTSIIFEMN